MDSNKIGTTELKYLWLLKKFAARCLLLLLNVYEFAKENSGDFKTTVVSVQNTVVSIFGPLYQKLKDLSEKLTEFVDDKFDKYAPSLAKNLVTESQSLVYETKPFVKKLVIAAQTVITPLITTAIFILKTTRYFIQSITPKPAPLFVQDQTILQNSLTTTQTLLQSAPIAAATSAHSLLQNTLDATKSLVPDNILQVGPDLANQAADATKSLVGGLPLMGNTTQSLVTNPTNLATQIANTTTSLANNNPLLQKGPDLTNPTADKTKSLFGGLPLMGNVAQSLTTNPINLANQIANTTSSLVKENPLLESVNLATQNSGDATKSLVGGIPALGNVAQSLTTNPTDLVNQIANTTNSLVKENPILDAVNSAAQSSLDATNSLVGGIPIVSDVAQSLTTNPTDLANQILNTTNSLVNDNPLLGAINSAAGNIGIKPGATGTKAALQSAYMTLKLAGIPVIAQLWYEFVKKYPTMGELLEFVLPVVECACVLYNKVVEYMDGKGYSIFGYLPIVPIDEMKAAYKLVKTSRDGLAAVGDLSYG